jgi:ABC-type metal ion transport system substrate-binding protein
MENEKSAYSTIRIKSAVREQIESARIAHESKSGKRLSISDFLDFLLKNKKTKEKSLDVPK